MSGQSHMSIDEIPIAGLRRDCAMVVRGMLLLAIIPAMIFILFAMHELRSASSFDIAGFFSWKIWVPLALTTLVMFALRPLIKRLDGTALMATLCGYAVLAAALSVAALWVLSRLEAPIPWGEIAAGLTTKPVVFVPVLLVLALASWLIWYSVLGPLRATLKLLRAKLPDGRRVIDVMNGVAAAATTFTVPRPSPAARAARFACFILAAVLGIVMAVSVVWLLAQERFVQALALEFPLLAAIIGLVRLGGRVAAVDAKTLLAADDRPPVLFLRSFQDDVGKLEDEWGAVLEVPDAVANSPAGQAASAALNTAPARRLGSIGVPRLEEAIAAEVGRLGPFVAIGAPDELLPRLGAARAYHENDTWQNAIQRWIDMAQLIVKVAGPTKWIQWELGHIINQGALMRLIIIFPKKGTAEDRAYRWRNMSVCFDGTHWQEPLSVIDPQNVMALRFKPHGGIQVITRAAHRGLDVALAMRILLDGVVRDGLLMPKTGPATQAG
ncbi:MAG: hypothetical protein ACR2PA_03090 [Hyphomicrobiaceae bacterium]